MTLALICLEIASSTDLVVTDGSRQLGPQPWQNYGNDLGPGAPIAGAQIARKRPSQVYFQVNPEIYFSSKGYICSIFS